MIDVFFKALVKAFKASPVPKAAPVVPAPAPKAPPVAKAASVPVAPKKQKVDLVDAMLNPCNPWYGVFND